MHAAKSVSVVVLVALAGTMPSGTSARIMEYWTYSALLDKSNLVVIATPTKTDTTKEIAQLPHITSQTPDGRTGPVMAIGFETTFRVAACLKGKKMPGGSLVLHHYATRPERSEDGRPIVVRGGPMLMQFDPASHAYYLMFLVRESDGRFAPTGGQTDPAAFGIHKLSGNAH